MTHRLLEKMITLPAVCDFDINCYDEIVYSSNLNGTQQIRTNNSIFFKEAKGNVRYPKWSPDGKRIVFLQESRGDERFCLHLISSHGKSIKILKLDGMIWFPKWSPNGDMIAFLSNFEGELSLYKWNPNDGDLKRVSPRNLTISAFDWSPDAGDLVFQVGIFDDTYLQTTSKIALNVSHGRVSIIGDRRTNSVWNRHGVICTTYSKEKYGVQVWKPDDGCLNKIDDNGHNGIWDTSGEKALYGKEQTRTVIRFILKNMSSGRTQIQQIDGMPYYYDFGPDYFEALIETFYSPSISLRGMIKVCPEYKEKRDGIKPRVSKYKSYDGQIVHQIIIEPKKRKKGLIIVHGGPFTRMMPNMYDPFAEYFFRLGYSVMYPNYRGSTGFGEKYRELIYRDPKGDMLDILYAVNYMLSRGYYELTIMGQSYGSYLTLMAMILANEDVRKHIKSLILFTSISDLKTFSEASRGFLADFFKKKFRGSVKLFKENSPIFHVNKLATIPIFLTHGRNDIRIPFDQSKELVRTLRTVNPHLYFFPMCGGHWSWTRKDVHTLSNNLQSFISMVDRDFDPKKFISVRGYHKS